MDTVYIPDPIELMESRIERWADQFVDEHTCMGCGKRVDYELICMSPLGDGPALCEECAGVNVQTGVIEKDVANQSLEFDA